MESGRFDAAIKEAFSPFERNGLIDVLQHTSTEGSQQAILVRPTGKSKWTHRVPVEDVLISKIKPHLYQRLMRELMSPGGMPHGPLC